MTGALELVGFALILAFCLVVWWPSALLVAGVLLLLVAYVRESRSAAKVGEPE